MAIQRRCDSYSCEKHHRTHVTGEGVRAVVVGRGRRQYLWIADAADHFVGSINAPELRAIARAVLAEQPVEPAPVRGGD